MRQRFPKYDLEHLQRLIGQGPLSRIITTAAQDGAFLLELDTEGIVEAVLELRPRHFYKCMEAEKRPGLWQDVYHLPYGDEQIYIKLQLSPDGRAVVVQFKPR